MPLPVRAAPQELASGFMGRAKFYEHISHQALGQEGELVDSPEELLQLRRGSCRRLRKARRHAAVSDELEVNGMLAEGCSCATRRARVLMHRTPRVPAREYPLVRY